METKKARTETKVAGESDIKKLAGMIRSIRYAMLVTHDESGELYGRPMVIQQQDFDGALWFFTRDNAAKSRQIQKDQRVNVSLADPDDNVFVSAS